MLSIFLITKFRQQDKKPKILDNLSSFSCFKKHRDIEETLQVTNEILVTVSL